jgi:protein-tyrosine phosphatase
MIDRLKRWLKPAEPAELAVQPELRVLMVCMGNICRSPTAEGVLRGKLQRAGLHGRIVVDSAGTYGGHAGEAPDPRAIRHAAQRGYDIGALRARAVAPADYGSFQWLLAMDEDNLAWLQSHAPAGSAAQVGLLMSHALRHPGELVVPDPYYGTAAGFERVLDLVEDACDGLLHRLRAALVTARPEAPKLD